MLTKRVAGFLASAAALAAPIQSHAAGFALHAHSAGGMGHAFADGAVATDDASVIFSNPAGITYLPEHELMLAGQYVAPTFKYTDNSSTAGTGSLSGGNDNGAVNALIPALYYTTSLSDKWRFGIAMNVPFGLSTKYDENWVGRYHAIESTMTTYNVNHTLAYRASDKLSLGFGFSAQYIDVTMSSAIDFGTIGSALGLTPQQNDGQLSVSGNDWSLGWNLGMIYAFDQDNRLGLHYRSAVKHKLTGDANFTVPTVAQPLIALTGQFKDTGATSRTTMPANAAISFWHRIDPRLALMADLNWTGWSVFDEMRIEYDNTAQADTVTPENWKNSWRIALGLDYAWDEQLTLRTGIAHDQTPVPDDAYRTPRVPDTDRNWLALGFGYKVDRQLTVDVSYVHLFIGANNIHNAEPVLGYTLNGSYDSSAELLSAQVRYNF